MDASAYLKKQGWRGDGHSLDHTDRGIRKPLLVSKKVDVLGVGLNKHAAVSDQWWLRAFDQGLKDLGTGKESVLGNVQKHGVNRGGLYGRFVRGEPVPGTIGESSIESTPVGSITPVEAVFQDSDAKKQRTGAEAAQRQAKKSAKRNARAQRKNLKPKKLALYAKRAAEKGVSVEEYIKRREEKYAAKQAKKMGNG